MSVLLGLNWKICKEIIQRCSSQDKKLGRFKGKSKADSFVWTDDEVELLLKVIIECNVSKTSEMSIGNFMPDEVLRYSGSFCNTVSFAIFQLGLFFARLSSG